MNTLIKYHRSIVLCLIIAVNALLLSACADWDIFLDMAEDWAMEKSARFKKTKKVGTGPLQIVQ